jgi:hypothetical protein
MGGVERNARNVSELGAPIHELGAPIYKHPKKISYSFAGLPGARQLSAGGPDWAARSRPPPRNDSTNAGLAASSAGVPSIRSSPPPMT